MKIVIRVDASIHIGSGHVMRCLVLAKQLSEAGFAIIFACLPQDGDLISFIRSSGFEVIKLTTPTKSTKPRNSSDYIGWLQRSVKEDAEDFVKLVMTADVVITDHYAIGQQWQSFIKQKLNCKIVAIDDLVREHDAEIIVDQTLGRKSEEYSSKKLVLAGCHFALISPSFCTARENERETDISDKPKILISMGGIDKDNITLEVLKTLIPEIPGEFSVLLSPRSPSYQAVKSWCSKYKNVEHIDFCNDMASLMSSRDIAIGAPGTTSWERACVGLPSIVIPLADNQAEVCQQLIAAKASLKVEPKNIPNELTRSVKQLLNSLKEFSERNYSLCDGRGVWRVVEEIKSLHDETSLGSYELIDASNADIKLVYDWQCHPNTRTFALNKNVPSWAEHHTWMTNKIKSPYDYFYLIVNRNSTEKVGVLRLDKLKPHNYLVSIFISPAHYGKNIALNALKKLDAIHPTVTKHATVLKENIASQKLFTKAAYKRIDEETFIRPPLS